MGATAMRATPMGTTGIRVIIRTTPMHRMGVRAATVGAPETAAMGGVDSMGAMAAAEETQEVMEVMGATEETVQMRLGMETVVPAAMEGMERTAVGMEGMADMERETETEATEGMVETAEAEWATGVTEAAAETV